MGWCIFNNNVPCPVHPSFTGQDTLPKLCIACSITNLAKAIRERKVK